MSSEPTALQRHARYFDRDRSGTIRWGETVAGMRALGVGRIWSAILSTIIHAALGPITQRRAAFGVVVAEIARGKHPSDTGVFDAEGRFVEERFDALFASASPGPDGARDRLTRKEMRAFQNANRSRSRAGDFFSFAEIKLFFCVASDTWKQEDGASVPAISRRRLRAFYRGTLLPALARHRRLRARGRRFRAELNEPSRGE